MSYVNERNLKDYVSNLANQKVKDILEKKIRAKFNSLPSKTFENQKYYLVSEIENTTVSFINEIANVISQNLNNTEVNLNQISSTQMANRDKYYRDESINKYLDGLISKYSF